MSTITIASLRLPGSKSDLPHCIEAIIPVLTESPNSTDVTIIDGTAAINMLKPTPAVNLNDYAKQVFIPYIKGQLQHAKIVDVVWDEYTPNSLKETTRKNVEEEFVEGSNHQPSCPATGMNFFE